MSLADSLTPKDTEEIKPGLFIQKRGDSYRQIIPIAWNGEVRWKQQLKTIFTFRTIFTIAIVLFLAYSYTHDIQQFKSFHDEVMGSPDQWCAELALLRMAPAFGNSETDDIIDSMRFNNEN